MTLVSDITEVACVRGLHCELAAQSPVSVHRHAVDAPASPPPLARGTTARLSASGCVCVSCSVVAFSVPSHPFDHLVFTVRTQGGRFIVNPCNCLRGFVTISFLIFHQNTWTARML